MFGTRQEGHEANWTLTSADSNLRLKFRPLATDTYVKTRRGGIVPLRRLVTGHHLWLSLAGALAGVAIAVPATLALLPADGDRPQASALPGSCDNLAAAAELLAGGQPLPDADLQLTAQFGGGGVDQAERQAMEALLAGCLDAVDGLSE